MTDIDTLYIYIEKHMNDTVQSDATCLNIPSQEISSHMGEEALSFGELLGIICIIAELITFMAGTMGFIYTPDTDNGSGDE